MATKYTYSVSTDFPNQVVSAARLIEEIQASAIVTALDHIDVAGDVCDIWFKADLSTGDETLLDGVVAAHTGEPPVRVQKTVAHNIDGEPLPLSPSGAPQFAAQPLQLGQAKFKQPVSGSELMNVNGTPAGTPVVLWNGTGAGDTGGDWTRSGVGSEATAAMHSGTNGLDTGSTTAGNTATFDNGSMTDVVGTYDAVAFWINPQAYPASSVIRAVWLDGSDAVVGSNVKVDDYVTNMDLGVWQKVTIPISDFNLTGNVQKFRLRFMAVDGQQHYIDDIELVAAGSGGVKRFRVAAESGTIYRTDAIMLVLVEENSNWSGDGFASLSALTNGLILRQVDTELVEDNVLWSINIKDNVDLFGRMIIQNDVVFGNGEHLFTLAMRPDKRVKASVEVTETKVLEWVVRDDLTDINQLRAYLHFGVEVIS